jgi:hypothetical protein
MSVTSGVLCTTPLACLRLAQLSPPQWSMRNLHDHDDLRSLFEKENLASIDTTLSSIQHRQSIVRRLDSTEILVHERIISMA